MNTFIDIRQDHPWCRGWRQDSGVGRDIFLGRGSDLHYALPVGKDGMARHEAAADVFKLIDCVRAEGAGSGDVDESGLEGLLGGCCVGYPVSHSGDDVVYGNSLCRPADGVARFWPLSSVDARVIDQEHGRNLAAADHTHKVEVQGAVELRLALRDQ